MTTSLSLLRCRNHQALTKQYYLDSDAAIAKRSYDLVKSFMVQQRRVDNIRQLSVLLKRLEDDPTRMIIRGVPHERCELNRTVFRKIHRESQSTTNINEHPFIDEPIPWLMLDIDGLELPEGIDAIAAPEEAIGHVISMLPNEFHQASCYWQYSSSMGMGSPMSISMHLWYWLQEPLTSIQLREWGKKVNVLKGIKLIDTALFQPVQPHYTAYPIFHDGVEDPLTQRSGFLAGETDEVALIVDIERPAEVQENESKPYSGDSHTFTGSTHGFDNILDNMGDHEGGEGFYQPLLRATSSYVAVKGIEVTKATRESLKDYIRQCIDDADQSKRMAGNSADHYKSDQFLDQCINGAIEKFGDEKEPIPPYFDTSPLPIEEAEEKLQGGIKEFTEQVFYYWQQRHREDLQDPSTWTLLQAPTLGIKAAAGIGKTTKMISDSIASGAFDSASIEFYVPSHTLSEELKVILKRELDTDLTEFGIEDYSRVQVIKGRASADEDGVVLCQKPNEVNQVYRLGLSVQKSLCDDNEHRCEFYHHCGYQAQFRRQMSLPEEITDHIEIGAGVRVMAHNHLFLHARDRLPDPMLVVVDEAFYQSGIDKITFQINELRSQRTALTTLIFDALYDQEPLLLRLRQERITPLQLYEVANEMQSVVNVNVSPVLSQRVQAERLSEAVKPSKIIHLLRALGDELSITDRDESHCVSAPKDQHGVVQEVVVRQRKELTIPSHIPVIFIDADLNKNILQQFRPDVPIVKIPVERQAEVVQFSDLTFSKYALVHQENNLLLDQAREFIAEVSGTGATLVVSTLEVRRAITRETKETQQAVGEYAGASMIHFGMLRGLDAFKEFSNVIILGREQPSVGALEGLASGLWWDAEEPVAFQAANESGGISLINEKRGYRMRDSSFESVQTQVHPDHRVQQLLEQIREAESAQAIDRLRLVRPNQEGSQRRVFILSSVPLDVTVDHLVGWKQYQQIKAVWNACNGVMPTNPEHLLIAAAGVVGSLGSAKRYAREQKKIMFLITYIIRGVSLFSVKYRPAGSRSKWSTAYVSSDVENYQQRLEELVGGEIKVQE